MKVFIAGGGTGGHIYPAVSIAQALQKLNSNIIIEFVGTADGLETKLVPRAGFNLHLVQSGKLNMSGKIFEKIKTLLKIPWGILQSINLLLKYKPDFVLGVGGYASAPMMIASILLGRKRALWEPNSHSGMANRILSGCIPTSYLVFEESKKYLKSTEYHVLGMPLRKEIVMAAQQQTLKTERPFSILCFGGSQGSIFLNDQIIKFVKEYPEIASKIKIFLQTGPRDFDRVQTVFKEFKNVEVFDFIYNMPEFYKKSDLVLGRGGASTIAEAAAFGVVPVIVPLPAADNHQQSNAESLVQNNCGFMLIQKEFKVEDFKNIIEKFMLNTEEQHQYSVRLQKLVPVNAAEKIAQNILEKIG